MLNGVFCRVARLQSLGLGDNGDTQCRRVYSEFCGGGDARLELFQNGDGVAGGVGAVRKGYRLGAGNEAAIRERCRYGKGYITLRGATGNGDVDNHVFHYICRIVGVVDCRVVEGKCGAFGRSEIGQ